MIRSECREKWLCNLLCKRVKYSKKNCRKQLHLLFQISSFLSLLVYIGLYKRYKKIFSCHNKCVVYVSGKNIYILYICSIHYTNMFGGREGVITMTDMHRIYAHTLHNIHIYHSLIHTIIFIFATHSYCTLHNIHIYYSLILYTP